MDGRQPVISVIVPVYNVEKYLKECINSIQQQTFTDFELILVNDGSTDSSGNICDDHAKKDCRIHVIHNENGGVSAARNSGIDYAKGKYIAFVDSDDILSTDYLNRLYSVALKESADVVICGLTEFNDGDTVPHIVSDYNNNVKSMTGPDALAYRYTGAFYVGPSGKLIALERLKSHRFPEGKKWEDQAVIPYVVYEANKVSVINDELYFYRIRTGSASHSTFSISIFDNIIHMNNFINYLKQNNEKALIASAKRHRNNTLALYTVMARYHGIIAPEGCKMNILKALSILRKNCTNDKYSWFLSRVYPKGVRYHEYYRKIESILTGKPL